MIQANGLTKKFGDFVAVDELELLVEAGEIYAFLGPNGAGKTTTIRMLTGTLRPTAGKIHVLDLALPKNEIQVKQRIGVVPDEPRMYENLRGREFLDFVAGVYRMEETLYTSRVEELFDAFSIDYANDYIGDYSHGMKQKLMLVSVLMRRPEVVFLDEPTVGLDARAARILKLLLEKMKSAGTTIFLTTHILEIAEKMSDRIGIIHNGKMLAQGTMEQLRQLSQGQHGSLEEIFLELTDSGEIPEWARENTEETDHA
ncbi:MAG TPA: ABC transporter ATP-binding protein [Thermotogota bacterium]|nr:ABC transporter ATP-binding protein [Thermotogota bacterium]